MTFAELGDAMRDVGLAEPADPPASAQRFADGVPARIEIPSVEGPRVFRAVLEEAEARGVRVNRISQGSGVMMLSDSEIGEMAAIGADAGIEVSLFIGPRAAWGIGAQANAAPVAAGVARGAEDVRACVAEARRATRLGIRSLLVADIGVLTVLAELRALGHLPESLLLKTSVMLPVANPATARTFERLGAGTINVATDLTPVQLAEIRAACSVPLDVYIEAPDDLGGFVRIYDTPAIVRAAAPVYLKFGLRGAPSLYPSGMHMDAVAVQLGRERVRRAELYLRALAELEPGLLDTRGGASAAQDLAVPVPA